MKYLPLILGISVLTLPLVSPSQHKENPSIDIIYPRFGFPAIVEKNSTITIIYQAPCCIDSAVISTSFDPIPDKIELKILSNQRSGENWYCKVLVPEKTPEELYNLTLCFGDISVTEPRAIYVENKVDGNFTFIHLTDFHVGDPRGMKESVWKTIGWKAAKRCIEEINLLNPDFVIITGDLVFGQIYPGEYGREYEKCYRILERLQVPTFMCPGNHDGYIQFGQDGFTFWKKYFGPLNYTFSYGNASFIAVNSYDWPRYARLAFSILALSWGGYISENQLKWIEKELSKSCAKLKIIMLHHNPLWNTSHQSLFGIGYAGREELLRMIERYKVNAVFAGHVHFDDVTIRNDTIFITTTTAASAPRNAYWGYRLVSIRNWSIVSYNYKEPKYSIPLYHIECKELDQFTKLVRNDLEKSIKVRLTFLVPTGNYSINNGCVVMERKVNDKMEVYVDVDVPEKSEIIVKLERVD